METSSVSDLTNTKLCGYLCINGGPRLDDDFSLGGGPRPGKDQSPGRCPRKGPRLDGDLSL